MPRINRRRRYRHKRSAKRMAARRECATRIFFNIHVDASEALKRLKRLNAATEFISHFKARLNKE